MSPEQPKPRRRYARYAALFGVVLGLTCSALPPDYRAVCHAVASVCTGGIVP